ncbi:MAG: class A beta-lactamase-related serine hydrolase [Brevundimonas sp.]|nr:MAG: class A beta-lactamase-related serine hydrolase [Brevundimonas sp.]
MITDRRTLMAAALALTATPALARDSAAADAALDAVFAEHAPVALGAAIIGREGVTWSGVRGVRQAGGGDPVSIRDRWHLGSNTKAMTAALYARLVEQGRARWDAPLNELFPDLVIDAGWEGCTIETFLHHCAGLADATAMGLPWLMTARADPRSLPDQRTALAAAFLNAPPAGTPGNFAYANGNYVIVGAAIERITGGSWEDAMTAEVFTPLGMASAGFGPPTANADGGANAWAHTGAGRQAVAPGPAADNPAALGPAGTVHATLEDYARFLAVFMGEGAGWLTPESVARLSTPVETPPPAYAAGWIVLPTRAWAQGRPLVHEGSNTMWHVVAAVAPKAGKAAVTVVNEGLANAAPGALMERLVGLA